jgi:uncharacterized membrane protein YphA (DoxX/SURF4 family)
MQTSLTLLKSNLLRFEEKFLLYKKEDGLFFPFFRISVSVFCLINFLAILPDFELLFTNDGLIPLNVLSIMKTDYMPSYNYLQNTLNHIGIPLNTTVTIYIISYCASCVFILLGLFTRFFSLLLLVLHLLIFQSSAPYMYGLEFFKSISLFYCFVFPVGNKMSLDALFFKKPEINPSPYRNLLKIHMAIVYFTSGLDKSFGINWWNGESIWKAIHLPGFKSHMIDNYNIFVKYPVLPILFGIGTIAVEFFYPLFMSIKKTRNIWLILTISLHVGIIIALNLYFFGILMILLNMSAYLTLEDEKHA